MGPILENRQIELPFEEGPIRRDLVEASIRRIARKRKIIAENVFAAGALYAAAQLEELLLFSVVEKIAQSFQAGLLPIQSRSTRKRLLQIGLQDSSYWLNEADRRAIYSQVVGGSDADVSANREFPDLWIAFLTAVDTFNRTSRKPARGRVGRFRVAEQAVRTAGRELAANLTLHTTGFSRFAAQRIAEQTRLAMLILRDDEIQSSYGAADSWQVIDRVGALELGGSPNIASHRARAEAGRQIIELLAKYQAEWNHRQGTPFLPILRTQNPAITAADWKKLRTAVSNWFSVLDGDLSSLDSRL